MILKHTNADFLTLHGEGILARQTDKQIFLRPAHAQARVD